MNVCCNAWVKVTERLYVSGAKFKLTATFKTTSKRHCIQFWWQYAACNSVVAVHYNHAVAVTGPSADSLT